MREKKKKMYLLAMAILLNKYYKFWELIIIVIMDKKVKIQINMVMKKNRQKK